MYGGIHILYYEMMINNEMVLIAKPSMHYGMQQVSF